MNDYTKTLRQHARPMEPIATDIAAEIHPTEGARAVLFDVYGTLFISGSGDIGTSAAPPASAFAAACEAMGLRLTVSAVEGAELLTTTIRSSHEHARRNGVEYPEVNIADVWRRVLEELQQRQWIAGNLDSLDEQQFAVEYEVRANPIWPMPGLQRSLERLSQTDLEVGIISNAQFFTPLLFSALLKQSPIALGFSLQLCHYSYVHKQAKPGTYLFERARESLQSLAIAPSEALYIGNDMLNDVMPASRVGFKTVLFAGDRRSLRMREGDQRVAGIQPDSIITSLDQLMLLLNIRH